LPTSIRIPMNENSSGFFVFPGVELAQKLWGKQKIRQCASAHWGFICRRGQLGITVVVPKGVQE